MSSSIVRSTTAIVCWVAILLVSGFCSPTESRADEATPETAATSPVVLKENGGWCWFQGPRAIVTKSGKLVFTSIAGDDGAGYDAGDLWATSWDLRSKQLAQFELHDRFHRDDHDVAGLLERLDGRVLAVYGKHGNDTLQRWRIARKPGSIGAWTEEKAFSSSAPYT